MLDWMKRRLSIARNKPETAAEPTKWQGRVISEKYLLLWKYLENRYANTVVLTFAEIEDLLGFTLPDMARLRQEWWTNAGANPVQPSYADSWILANRTAKPNLLAQTVVFERVS